MAEKRHHAVHPPSAVKPNLAINQKPNYVPPEQAAQPTVRVPTVVKAVAREDVAPPVPFVSALRRDGDAEDVSDTDSENYDPDDPAYDPSLDDSE